MRGKEKLPKGACLVASKHQSAWETFALIPLFRDPALSDEARAVLDPVPRLVLLQVRDDPGRSRQGPGSASPHAAPKPRRAPPLAARSSSSRKARAERPAPLPDYKTGVFLLYEALGIPCVPVALNSGAVLAAAKPEAPSRHHHRRVPRPHPARTIEAANSCRACKPPSKPPRIAFIAEAGGTERLAR